MNIIKSLLGFVKSFFKTNSLFLINPILLIGLVLLSRRSRSWKESFADTGKILELLVNVFVKILSIFFGVFGIQLVKMFDEAEGNV